MKRGYHKYTDEQLEYLKEISPKHTNKETTKMFNKKFNLNQSARTISYYRKSHNIPSKYSGVQETNEDGTFKKGKTPWNKGLKGYMGANRTSFKKGHVSNIKPVGSERVCTKDNYIIVKTENPNKWEHKHRVIWKKHHGEIPEGHAILFGDGDIRNFDIDNLICVSRAQLAMLNKNNMIQNNVELTKTALNIIDLQRKISERSEAL